MVHQGYQDQKQRLPQRIGIAGAGLMGSHLALLFASQGLNVSLYDPFPEAIERVKSTLAPQLEKCGDAAASIVFGTTEDILATSDFVIEAIPEKLTLKHDLFQSLERLCRPDTIFATNTSGLSINAIAQAVENKQRFLGTHFFTPASIIPLVEVVRGDATSDEAITTAMDLLRAVGKRPVLIQHDIPGFIANRIQHALAREAMSLLEKGVASAEDIDEVVRWSLGVRLVFTGPLEQRDINGLDIHHAIASYLYPDLENRTVPSKALSDAVARGDLGMKSGKGFYSWDKNAIEACKDKKNKQLAALIKWIGNSEA